MLNLNRTGESHAKRLIRQGKVDRKSAWKFTSSDSNKLLGNDNWSEYKKWFLATDSEKSEDVKAHYKFPFGKEGKVYRSGIIAAKRRAAQYGHKKIESVANTLLELIDRTSNWFTMKATDDGNVEALIYGVIGYECAADEFIGKIKEIKPKNLTIRVNSPGGSVFDGLAIYNYLKQADFNVDVFIDGLAASAASVIACAGTLNMPENALFMIHNPSSLVGGESKDMLKQAEVLDKIRNSIVSVYQEKTNLAEKKIVELMDSETWLNAKEAKKYGFCDNVLEPVNNFTVFDLSDIYNNVPDYYMKRSDINMSKEKKFFASVFEAMGIDIDLESVDVENAYQMIEQSFMPEEEVNEPELPADVVARMKEYENKIAALETANLVKQIEPKVGGEIASLLGRAHRDMKDEVFNALVDKIEGMRKAINDLGAKKGENANPTDLPNIDNVVDKKVKEIANELDCSMTDALIELAKRDPELVANWR